MAAIGTILWSFLDRKRLSYDTAYYWLTGILRYYLAFTLFLFALEKFFKMQFPDPGLYTLTEQVGNLTPMNLALSFFGYSYGYNVFMGIAECAALLLLFRRTMVFGAILTLITLGNVVAVNFSFDVHAKLYPTVLAIMTFFLLLPYLSRLFKFFFTDQSTTLPVLQALVLKKRWMNMTKNAFKFLLIGCFAFLSIKDYMESKQKKKNREMDPAQVAVSGIYDIQSFVVNEDTLSDESPQRWKQLVIEGSRGRIRLPGDSVANMFVSVNDGELLVYKNQKHLSTHEQKIFDEYGFLEATKMNIDSILIARQVMSRFQFALADSTTITIHGTHENNSVSIIAKKRAVDKKNFRLIKNGFHWITE
jgi:hypothetical protein